MKKFFGGICLFILMAFFFPALPVDAAEKTIAKGVSIGGIDVSGMTVEQATATIEDYINNMLESEIALSAGREEDLTITGADLGIVWDNTGVIDEAYALGHEGNIVERYMALKDLEVNNHAFDIEYGFDNEAIAEILDRCGKAFNQKTINFGLTKTGEGFQISEGQTGYLVNVDESAEIIKTYVKEGKAGSGEKIELSIDAEEPLGSYEELSKVKDVLGSYTTSYSTSGTSRSANVANGCKLINGATVYPGEEFSVLDAITPFTAENGYYLAGSYKDGIVVDTFGGGICQVSTTLYNAVLLAELEVTERHNHSMVVTYVASSADAAIAESSGKNFKFVNNTQTPIYIEGYTTSDKHITFNVYGQETRPSGRKVSYESKELERTNPSADQINVDGSQALGYVGTQSAHPGVKAELWKIVTENGESKREKVNSSTYKMVPRIITVGVSGADENDMAKINSAIATKDVGTIKAVAGALKAAKTADSAESSEAAYQMANDAINAQVEAEAQPEEDAESIATD
ncbi:MAG: VanW family protein [Butyrivibrio sp.]|nr:VanW family protein [Butyrivibrio sp.]